jgi:hypothetical protein
MSRNGSIGTPWRTTADFAALDDHARLPWRFFSRLQATEDRGAGRL